MPLLMAQFSAREEMVLNLLSIQIVELVQQPELSVDWVTGSGKFLRSAQIAMVVVSADHHTLLIRAVGRSFLRVIS